MLLSEHLFRHVNNMAVVVQRMLEDGAKLHEPEPVHVNLIQGIRTRNEQASNTWFSGDVKISVVLDCFGDPFPPPVLRDHAIDEEKSFKILPFFFYEFPPQLWYNYHFL